MKFLTTGKMPLEPVCGRQVKDLASEFAQIGNFSSEHFGYLDSNVGELSGSQTQPTFEPSTPKLHEDGVQLRVFCCERDSCATYVKVVPSSFHKRIV